MEPGEHAVKPSVAVPKGILKHEASAPPYTIARHASVPELAFWVQHYWIARWNTEGRAPFVQTIIAHPCVNIVFERHQARVYGIPPVTSSRQLEGKGCAVGIMFRPGAFYSFYPQLPASHLTGLSWAVADVFQVEIEPLLQTLFADEDQEDQEDQKDEDERLVNFVNRFLLERLPEQDANIDLLGKLVDTIRRERSITRVEDVAAAFDLQRRTLERLFEKYVGVSPKWVIQHCRLQEAACRLDNEPTIDATELALELGYYDQSHFIRDFKGVVGMTPEAYRTKQTE